MYLKSKDFNNAKEEHDWWSDIHVLQFIIDIERKRKFNKIIDYPLKSQTYE